MNTELIVSIRTRCQGSLLL
jgi:hypothetical protein